MTEMPTVQRHPPLYPPTITPADGPLPLHRFLPRFIDNPIAAWPKSVFEEDVVQLKTGRNEIAWVSKPEFVKRIMLEEREDFGKTPLEKRVLGPLFGNGLLTSEGRDWKWQRQTAAPLFRHQDILDDVPAFGAAADEMIAAWARNGPASGQIRPIDRDMSAATLSIIYKTLLAGGERFIGDALEKAQDDYLSPISWEIGYAVIGLPRWLPHPGKRRMRALERRLREAVFALVSSRRRTPSGADDLLTRLLLAKNPETREPMSDEQLVDNLLTFYSAGHATTAMALTWTLYLLARSPDWLEQVVAEVDRVTLGNPIERGHIEQLIITQMVLKEALRLYPPAPVLTRLAAKTTIFGTRTLAAGTHIVVPVYAIHRHRKLWSDPDRFDPSRFSPASEKALDRYQYMPFGAGPRICIGMAFALAEATVLLARFLQSVRFEHVPGCDPEPMSRVTLRPRGGMRLLVGARYGEWPAAVSSRLRAA